MPKEIYCTVSNELKERGNDERFSSLSRLYLVVTYFLQI